MSDAYLARPDTLSGLSNLATRCPMMARFDFSGHSYLGIGASSFLLGRLQNCVRNSHVGAATAEITSQPLAHLLEAWSWVLVEEGFAGHDKPRRAIATLLGIVIHESLLKRMQFPALRQAFHSLNVFTLSLDRKHRARVHRFAVDDHGARATRRAVTHPLGASEFQFVAQNVQERQARLDIQGLIDSVDL